jgi:hypothetical protein
VACPAIYPRNTRVEVSFAGLRPAGRDVVFHRGVACRKHTIDQGRNRLVRIVRVRVGSLHDLIQCPELFDLIGLGEASLRRIDVKFAKRGVLRAVGRFVIGAPMAYQADLRDALGAFTIENGLSYQVSVGIPDVEFHYLTCSTRRQRVIHANRCGNGRMGDRLGESAVGGIARLPVIRDVAGHVWVGPWGLVAMHFPPEPEIVRIVVNCRWVARTEAIHPLEFIQGMFWRPGRRWWRRYRRNKRLSRSNILQQHSRRGVLQTKPQLAMRGNRYTGRENTGKYKVITGDAMGVKGSAMKINRML